jgi:chemotaxis protein CheD
MSHHASHSAKEVYLQPGQYHVGDSSCRIRTLLGSCVSITIWHPKFKIGAMSHFLLPTRSLDGPHEPDARYGDEAMWLMLRELAGMGVQQTQCEGKIFGGGNMFPQHKGLDSLNVGQKNGLTARALLANCGIPVVSESLFGVGHRNIVFDVMTGHVWSRQIKPDI